MEDYSCSYIEIHFYTEDGSLHCRLHQGSTVPRALLLSLEGRIIPFALARVPDGFRWVQVFQGIRMYSYSKSRI